MSQFHKDHSQRWRAISGGRTDLAGPESGPEVPCLAGERSPRFLPPCRDPSVVAFPYNDDYPFLARGARTSALY
jgi:hypothetical protein